ncbi:hypothetical protein AVEN_149422-1 [Araneus ventricosus]|uniref:Uncharacterized protein n=1 Tax=Araneus ventricosus TaxID=182803 RepID=A0A4Y2PBT5_ARAVE|nr:hypothetical protein AVEN_149422-1 [Araneus ventricosus]
MYFFKSLTGIVDAVERLADLEAISASSLPSIPAALMDEPPTSPRFTFMSASENFLCMKNLAYETPVKTGEYLVARFNAETTRIRKQPSIAESTRRLTRGNARLLSEC